MTAIQTNLAVAKCLLAYFYKQKKELSSAIIKSDLDSISKLNMDMGFTYNCIKQVLADTDKCLNDQNELIAQKNEIMTNREIIEISDEDSFWLWEQLNNIEYSEPNNLLGYALAKMTQFLIYGDTVEEARKQALHYTHVAHANAICGH